MSSAMQKLSAAAETTGLSFDRERNILYGTFGNYAFAVLVNASNVRYCSILFHVTRDGNPFTANDGKEIAKESNKLLQFAKPSGAAPASFLVKLEKDEQGTAQRVLDALTFLSTAFSNRGYVNTCESCRQEVATEPCTVGNGLRFLCPDCFESVSASMNDRAHREAETPENVPAGIVGALGGALLGAVVVVIFGRLGYVTALSGLIAAICALKGYELLAKKMSVKGAIISCIAMLAMIYVGHRADWAIEAAQYFTLLEAELGQYLKGLFMVYLFAILGAVPTVISSLKQQKTKYTVQKLN